jgi:predicted RNase H-like nuclease
VISVAGVDGCRAGWVVVHEGDAAVQPNFAGVLDALPDDAMVAVDMPIGLPERTGLGGRAAENCVRPLLGARQSSVFSVPSRAAIYAADYVEACGLAHASSDPPRKVSRQLFMIAPKIREVDACLLADAAARRRVFEVHPELSFAAMNDGQPVLEPKRSATGSELRRALLARAGVQVPARPPGAASDDLLDACALAWSAHRIADGTAHCIPDAPACDERGLRMELRW